MSNTKRYLAVQVPTNNCGNIGNEREQDLPPLICIEPAHVPIERVRTARGLTRVEVKVKKRPRITSRDSRDATTARSNLHWLWSSTLARKNYSPLSLLFWA